MAASDPYTEVEVKIRFPEGADAARRLIEGRGFAVKHERVHESDQLFDREGELRGRDMLLRLRRIAGRATVTYKGPGTRERYKSREEIEFDVSDPRNFEQVLERLGYHPAFRYEKYRTTFHKPGEDGEVTVDETPAGVFLELEGEPAWIDRTAAILGLSAAQYLTQSYASIYAEYRRTNPGAPADMVFGS
jgi:adenylate cyclase class 2